MASASDTSSVPNLSWLLQGSGISRETFLSEYFGKKPLVINRKQAQNHYGQQFTFRDGLLPLLKQERIHFGQHINAFRFAHGVKTMLNNEGRATVKSIKRLFNNGASFQFHQPQQYHPSTAQINFELEQDFGCLVGGNIYVTPPESQGLAPHYDDVDVFVLQFEGIKHWKLVLLPDEDALPLDPSEDLTHEEIGAPDMEVTLHPGDFLYLPRGVIHEAFTGKDAPSTHLTLSTFQRHCVGQLLRAALPDALERALEDDVAFRRHLPTNVFGLAGFHTSGDASSTTTGSSSTSAPNALTALQNQLEGLVERLKRFAGEQLHSAVDDLSLDFICNRLPPTKQKLRQLRQSAEKDVAETQPPHKKQKRELDAVITPPLVDSLIRIIDPSFVRVVRLPDKADEDESESESESDEDDEDDEVDTRDCGLFHCLQNDVRTHMAGQGEPHCLRFPHQFAPALAKFVRAFPEFVSASELGLSAGDGQLLVSSLWAEELLAVQS